MSRDTESLVARVLADRAAAVPSPPAGLADAARHQARTRRRNQGLAAVVGAVVVAVALVAPAVLGGGGHRVQQLPAGPTDPTLTVPDGAVTRVTLDTFAPGAAPGVAWTAAAVLHRTDGRSLGLPLGPVPAAQTPDGGAFIADSNAPEPALRRVDTGGDEGPATDVSWPVVGEHGQFGYLDRSRGQLVTEQPDGTGGAVEVPFDVSGSTLVGWFGYSAVIANVPGGNARLIDTQGKVSPLRGQAQATATDGRAMVASRSADGSCLEVRLDGRRLWRSCNNRGGFSSIVAISPNSHHALVRRTTSAGAGEYAVLDAATGAVQRLFTAASGSPEQVRAGLGQAVFETDDSVLIAVFAGPGESIVRCSLAGACELAVPHADMAEGPEGPQPFDPAWVP